jgi:hypothetical protein
MTLVKHAWIRGIEMTIALDIWPDQKLTTETKQIKITIDESGDIKIKPETDEPIQNSVLIWYKKPNENRKLLKEILKMSDDEIDTILPIALMLANLTKYVNKP